MITRLLTFFWMREGHQLGQIGYSSRTGMPIIDSVVPGGPAYLHLDTSVVLVHVNDEVVTQFLDLETLLDNSVNQRVKFHVERGDFPITLELEVWVCIFNFL